MNDLIFLLTARCSDQIARACIQRTARAGVDEDERRMIEHKGQARQGHMNGGIGIE